MRALVAGHHRARIASVTTVTSHAAILGWGNARSVGDGSDLTCERPSKCRTLGCTGRSFARFGL